MPPGSILISVIFSLLHRSAQSTSSAKMQRLHSTFWLSEPLFKVINGEKQHKRYKWNAGRERVKGVSLHMDLATGPHSGKTVSQSPLCWVRAKRGQKNSNIQQPQTLGKSRKRPKNSNIQQPQTLGNSKKRPKKTQQPTTTNKHWVRTKRGQKTHQKTYNNHKQTLGKSKKRPRNNSNIQQPQTNTG